MMVYDCDAIRDLLPSLVRGEMMPHEAASMEQHVAGCGPCREEAEIVRVLQDALAAVPEGLEARVLAAVRRRSSTRWTPTRLAIAATVAVVVLGGSVVFNRMAGGRPEAGDSLTLGWAAAEDPLLHGSSPLHEMSLEELEAVLVELER